MGFSFKSRSFLVATILLVQTPLQLPIFADAAQAGTCETLGAKVGLVAQTVSETGRVVALFVPASNPMGPAPDLSFAPNYDQLLATLVPGDRITMGDGQSFVVHGFLSGHPSDSFPGHAVSHVIDVGDGWAVKIPTSQYAPPESQAPANVQGITYLGYSRLKDLGVPVVEVDTSDPNLRPRTYFKVRVEPLRYTLEGFLNGKGLDGRKIKISSSEQSTALAALDEFARASWRLTWNSDFHIGQMGWNGQRWILFDWGNSSASIGSFKDKDTAFDHIEKYVGARLPKDLRKHLADVTNQERDVQKAGKENWFQRPDRLAAAAGTKGMLIRELTPRPIPAGSTYEYWPLTSRPNPAIPGRFIAFKLTMGALLKTDGPFDVYQAVQDDGAAVQLMIAKDGSKDTLAEILRRTALYTNGGAPGTLLGAGGDFFVYAPAGP